MNEIPSQFHNAYGMLTAAERLPNPPTWRPAALQWGLRALAIVGIAAFAVTGTQAQQPFVEITGGADTSGQNYEWKVTNRHDSPIVWIQFPHFHADLFQTPNRWTQECTNLIGAGKPSHLSGVCTASVDSAEDGIAAGRSARFGMRLALLGGDHPRPGQVRVRFADGTETVVADVELPTASSRMEKLVAPLGLALIFGIIVLVQLRRRKKTRAAAPADPDAVSRKT